MMSDTWLGMLYIQKELLHKLTPAIGWGGSIEEVSTTHYKLKSNAEKFEPGTPHIIWALCLLKAIEYIESIWWYEAIQQHEQTLITHTLHKFQELWSTIKLIGPETATWRIWVFSFVVPSHPNHIQLWEKLAEKGICVRTWAHCTHPFFEHIEKNGSCRMSLYIYNTIEDIDFFFTTLKEITDANEKPL